MMMRWLIVVSACVTLIGWAGCAVVVESEDGTNSRRPAIGETSYYESDEDSAAIEDDDDNDDAGDDDDDDDTDVVYDEKQIDGETNIRLHIKNFQIQVPESTFDALKKAGMAALIRDSILNLFGIPTAESDKPSTTTSQDLADQQHQVESNSMLQVNGNNLPAKFFLEISDFLMNNHDTDAVDDKRVESNHRKNAEIYATEELKIERLQNVNNVKNETITISKKRYQVAPQNQTHLLEMTNTENKFSNNVTRNHTESEDRFQQTRPIQLDSVLVKVETDSTGRPKTLREKVIWRMDDQN